MVDILLAGLPSVSVNGVYGAGGGGMAYGIPTPCYVVVWRSMT